jgi:dihydroxy-acid dehydratase
MGAGDRRDRREGRLNEEMTKSDDNSGMRKGLTNYGDAGFSLFLRKAFIKGAGYTDGALDRPVGRSRWTPWC